MFDSRFMPDTLKDVIQPLGADTKLWAKEAGMDWSIKSSPVFYEESEGGSKIQVPNRKVLYRSDNFESLGIISKNYKVVQPKQILDFFQDLVASGGYSLETAGTFKGGHRFWGLAKTEHTLLVGQEDAMQGYLLLCSGADGNTATQAFFTSYRLSCLNSMGIATSGRSVGKPFIAISHSQNFDENLLKDHMHGLSQSWESYGQDIERLASTKVPKKVAVQYFLDLLYPNQHEVDISKTKSRIATLMRVYEEEQGQDLVTAKGTAWGLVNAITRYTDHHTNAKTNSARMDRAWFGENANLKAKAWKLAQNIAA